MAEAKDFTSDVESARLASEEFVEHRGQPVFPSQIWRDGLSIPSTSPLLENYTTVETDLGNYDVAEYKIEYATKSVSILKHFIKLPLTRVVGTNNCFYQENLIDIIPYNYDTVNHSYMWNIYINGSDTALKYGIGGIVVDRASGVLSFDSNFCKDVAVTSVSITFYQYTGRKGFFGTTLEEDIPFSDEKSLLFKSDNPSIEVSLKARGLVGVNKYVLPPVNTYFYTKEDADNECGVIVVQENLNNILDTIGIVDGGTYL